MMSGQLGDAARDLAHAVHVGPNAVDGMEVAAKSVSASSRVRGTS